MAIPIEVGRVVQYRITAADAVTYNTRPGVVRRYAPGDILPAVVLTSRSTGRCDLQVFLHGPVTAYLASIPEHYAADGSWTRIPGR